MSLAIHLLGPTRVERSGDEIPPPRGHKAWGLLTYLVRTPAPSSRERLGGLLFPEADDPMGSLRWTLSVLRRFLGDDVVLAGDPLRLSLPPGTFVDVDVLSRGSWVEAVALPGLGHELLDGMAFPSSPGFENWLENERRYVAGTTAGVLRQAALGRLGYGEPRIAVKHASELVRLEPFDQNAHALLVRCMRAVGTWRVPRSMSPHVSSCFAPNSESSRHSDCTKNSSRRRARTPRDEARGGPGSDRDRGSRHHRRRGRGRTGAPSRCGRRGPRKQ